jgi:hypothetical protein
VDVAGFGGGPVSAAALAVSGSVAVASQVDAAGVQRLLVLQRVGSNLVPRYLGAGGNRRFVVSDNGFVAADRCEADVGQDLNGDGFEDECVLDLVNGRTGAVQKTGTTLIPCTSDACDRRWPWRIFSSGETSQNATARVLTWECQECGSCGPTPRTPEACCDLDQNGSCEDVIIQEITFDERRYVLSALSENAISDPLAGPQSGQGGFDQGAVLPALIGRCESDPSVACQTAANCPRADDACIDRVPAVQAYSDSDGDGIFDGYDNCQFDFNPDQTNGDGDPAGDGCDLLNCGDGVVEPLEYCDEGAANGTAGSSCTAICTPVVNVSVSESAVNPGQAGGVPGTILGNRYLNLATTPVGDRPAKMIDPGSIHFEGVRSSERCAKEGPGLTKHDLTDAQRYSSHLGNSALPDLSLHIDVPSSQVATGDTELCVTGAFRNVPGRFRPARFETRVPLNVR